LETKFWSYHFSGNFLSLFFKFTTTTYNLWLLFPFLSLCICQQY
jgi:hypothetical protein